MSIICYYVSEFVNDLIMQNKDFILMRIIDSYQYSPLRRSVRFSNMLSLLSDAKKSKLIEGFAKFLSEEITNQVRLAIKSQKFKIGFKPLSPQYLEFKRRRKLELGFWRSTDFLLNNLKWWKYGNEYRIGWIGNLLHPGVPNLNGKYTTRKKVNVVFIAKNLEFGTKVIKKDGKIGGTPARPIFLPITLAISKSISLYLDRYLKKINFSYL